MKLLIIEDDHVVRSLLEKVLQKSGFEVDSAEDATMGEKFVAQNRYDCIILDLGLPDKDGLQLCKEFREQGMTDPILIVSAYGEIETKVSGLNTGADDYITKPFDNSELIARINALVRRRKDSGESAESIIQYEELEINLIDREFKIGNQKVSLTNNEFNLLAYMMKHPNSLITKEEILEHVFDMKFETQTNFINVYISYIRKKINAKTSKNYIRTVRSKGFILRTEG